MSSYLRKAAEQHAVRHDSSGTSHYFKVKSKSGREHGVELKLSCTCEFSSIHAAKGMICSHILAVIDRISKQDGISLNRKEAK